MTSGERPFDAKIFEIWYLSNPMLGISLPPFASTFPDFFVILPMLLIWWLGETQTFCNKDHIAIDAQAPKTLSCC